MATIYCSKKFGDFLGKEKFAASDNLIKSELGDWNGHLFYYRRKKYLMFFNNKTYYGLLFPPLKKADLQDFENVFLQRLLNQLICDKVISRTETLVILQKMLPLILFRTNNDKKAIGTLNEFIFQFKVQFDHFGWDNQEISTINSKLNDTLVGAGGQKQGDYSRPIENMKALIDAFT